MNSSILGGTSIDSFSVAIEEGGTPALSSEGPGFRRCWRFCLGREYDYGVHWWYFLAQDERLPLVHLVYFGLFLQSASDLSVCLIVSLQSVYWHQCRALTPVDVDASSYAPRVSMR